MQRYAQITDGRVTQVIESETDPDGINGAWIACGDDVSFGDTYDGTDFTRPVPPAPARHTSVGAFFDRFGPLKWTILASSDATVKALIDDCSVRKYIDLDNPDLPAGLAMLEAAGYAIDASAILNMPALPKELP